MLAYDVVNIINSAILQTPLRQPSSKLDREAFLQLLVAQLSNQDPLDPMTNDEFVSQLTLFGSLEQQMILNENFVSFLLFQQLTQGSSLLGKEVISLVPSSDGITPVKGEVEQVLLIGGNVYLKLSGGEEIPLSTVVSVERGGVS